MTAPQIGVLALQGAVAEHVRALTTAGAEVRTVRRPAELEGLDGLVVPGGESTTMARLAAPVRVMEAIRAKHDAGMAVFGTCAGLILLAESVADAEALEGFERIGGLDVRVRRNGYGSQLDSFTEDLAVAGLPDEQRPLSAVFIRAPQIEEAGEDVEILAASEVATLQGADGERRPVAVRQGRLLGASFHPELTEDTRLHRLFVEMAGGA